MILNNKQPRTEKEEKTATSEQLDALALTIQRELAAMNNTKLDLISRMEDIEAAIAELKQFHPTKTTKWY